MKNKLPIIAVVVIILLAFVIMAVVLLTKPTSDNTADTAAPTVVNEATAADVTQFDVTEAAIFVADSDTVLPDGTLSA